MSNVGATEEVSSAEEPQPNGSEDAVNKCVQIDIRDRESGEIEFTFSLSRSQELQSLYEQVWNAFDEMTGREDLRILKLDGRTIVSSDTANSLGMSAHTELMCYPVVIVEVCNFWTRKKEWSWIMDHNESFCLIQNLCMELRGNDGFDLSYNGQRLKLNETPSSLGCKNRVELVCIPVPVITIVLKYKVGCLVVSMKLLCEEMNS